MYKKADIYLLDDPLSAVDMCVGKHLFNKCIYGNNIIIYNLYDTLTVTDILYFLIIGYLKEKICFLVTHQIQYLKNVDQIVLFENVSIILMRN